VIEGTYPRSPQSPEPVRMAGTAKNTLTLKSFGAAGFRRRRERCFHARRVRRAYAGDPRLDGVERVRLFAERLAKVTAEGARPFTAAKPTTSSTSSSWVGANKFRVPDWEQRVFDELARLPAGLNGENPLP